VGSCNGVGTCTPGPALDCGAYACAGTACGTSCSSDASCTPGYVCINSSCTALPGPVLYWKLDETSGTTVFDATSGGSHGVYTSAVPGVTPTSSSMLPPLAFANAASRQFSLASRQAILLADAPAALKPTAELTVSVWYRASAGDPSTGESEVFSMGDNFNLRLRRDDLEIGKRTSGGHKQCHLASSKVFDGAWHHLAGVITATDMRVYFDGNPSAVCPQPLLVYYPSSRSDLWIGRHGIGTSDARDFEGHLDEIRLYTRALSAAEIARLAAGKP
jgi:hypothetical protein